MNRIVKEDYQKLLTYFSSYSLESVIEDSDFLDNIKIIHRKLYSYLILIREMEQHDFFTDKTTIDYYSEAGSDLILSLFCWANGAYKPSEFQLRSSIENFIKASLFSENANIIQCKNVFEIMNLATNSSFFNNSICAIKFNKVKNTYANLCAFVHSSPNKLSSQIALIELPKYNKKNACEFTNNFQAIMDNLLSIMYYNYYSFIHKIHNTNRELFLQGLTPTDKSEIYKEKTKES